MQNDAVEQRGGVVQREANHTGEPLSLNVREGLVRRVCSNRMLCANCPDGALLGGDSECDADAEVWKNVEIWVSEGRTVLLNQAKTLRFVALVKRHTRDGLWTDVQSGTEERKDESVADMQLISNLKS